MIAFVLLSPMMFISVGMSIFMGTLAVMSYFVMLIMAAFMGVMMTWSTSFLTFMIIVFS